MKNDHLGRFETELAFYAVQLGELSEAEASDEAVRDFKAKYEAAERRLAEFRAAPTEARVRAAIGVERAWYALDAAFDRLPS